MSRDVAKTITYLAIHLTIGFSVAYLFTGSLAIAGGIAMVEPLANAVAYFFHERAWREGRRPSALWRALACRHGDPAAT